MDYLIGNHIKGYELLELIGTGGFGAVYRAHQAVVARAVAIKVILPEFANAPMFVRRFETEAQLVARLEHPYIVPLYDYWREPSGAYLVMRYLRGGSLSGRIKQDGPLNLEQTGKMLGQIASALAVAHKNGVIHRDLKPDNILMDEAGNYYLSDFGIAKDISRGLDITQAGTIVGSPAYLSPEQITGDELTPLSDIYTLGILLYYALTGEHPFPGKTPTAMMMHQINDLLPPVNTSPDGLPDAVEEVLQRSTAKSPADRYQSVQELALAYNRAMHSSTGTTPAERRLTSEEASLIITGLDPEDIPNPYKGLKAFEEADADEFYGRTALTSRLVDRLQPRGEDNDGDHLLVVVGPSGSGKSSVVKAGLLPALRAGRVPDAENWFYADMVPGTHPMEEMEAALLRVAINPPDSLLRQLQEDERGFVRAVKRVLPEDGSQLVLFIDQFEEVFTLTENEAERLHFLTSLLVAVTEPRTRLRLVITLRADFYDRPLSYHAFGELVRNYTEVVLPLSSTELEEAIVQPARQVGISLERGLASAIVSDVRDQPGALPLLQYALTQLFDQRDGGRLTLAAYNDIGGAMGALAQRAEDILQSLADAKQALARQMFLRLVTLGEGTEDTRRRAKRSELNALGPEDKMDDVIDTFGRQHLLTFDNDPHSREPTLEVAHEALIREWRRLGSWLDNAREDLRTQRRLFSATQDWLAHNRETSYLAHGARLDQFETLQQAESIAMNQDEMAYLTASLEARRAREEREAQRAAREEALEQAALQRLQLLVAVASVAAVIGVLLALFAFQSQREAVSAREAAEQAAIIAQENESEAQAVALAANALTLIDNYRPTLALNLALEAVAVRPDVTSVQQALSAAAYAPAALAQVNPFDDASFLDVAFMADGNSFLAGTGNGRLLVIDTETYAVRTDIEAHTDENGVPMPVYAVAVSRTGDMLASGDGNGNIRLWTRDSGRLLNTIEAHGDAVTSLTFGPDGETLLSAGADATVYLWDVASGEQLVSYAGHVGRVFAADWATNANVIVTSTGDDPNDGTNYDRAVRVFNAETGDLLSSWSEEGTGWLRAVAVSDDGLFAAVASYDPNEFGGTIRLLDTTTGEVVGQLTGHTDVITAVDISPDGTSLISGGWDRTMRHWDIDSETQIQRFDTHNDRLLRVAFSPDGKHTLVTAGRDTGTPDDPRAFYYALEPLAQERMLVGHEDWLWSVAFHPDGNIVATGSGDLNLPDGDNTVRLWNLATGREVTRLEGHENTIPGLDFHPDGDMLASGSLDGTVRLWDTSTYPNVRPVAVLEGHESGVNDVDFGPQGDLLSAGEDGTLRLWSLTSNEIIRTIEAHPGAEVIRAKFSPDGELVASSGTDSMVRVWNIRTGEEVRTLAGHTGWVSTVNFSRDGRFIVSGADNDLIIWDLEAPEDDPIYRVLVGHQGFVYGADFNPTGDYVLSGASDTSVRLWDVASGQEIRHFDEHTNWVLDVEFSPNGGQAVTVGEDNVARVWHIAQSTDELLEWIAINRYTPELTCAQRDRYNVTPLCDVLDGGGEGRGREDRSAAPAENNDE